MREGGGRREVRFQGLPLGGGRGLGQEVDHLGDLGFCLCVCGLAEECLGWVLLMGACYVGLP